MHFTFFGSSIVSAYWNGAATYYRGIIRALHERGHTITFCEPDAYHRQQHRDLPDPDWCRVEVYDPFDLEHLEGRVREAGAHSDIVVKCSGVGANDALLERLVAELDAEAEHRPRYTVFWDVDAPATLDRIEGDGHDPFRALIPRYSLVLTYGGGPPVVEAYQRWGARRCVPIYNAVDPATHHPAPPESIYEGDLAFLGNRLPDREARVETFFLRPAEKLPGKRFLIGGSGWEDKPMPGNVTQLGHVGTADHNAFNSTPLAVLNIGRESMARYGYSPATRVFEAAGAGACLITDAWVGLDTFLVPEEECLAAADGDEVAAQLEALTPERASAIGDAARRRVLADHTYAQRVEQLEVVLAEDASA